MPIIGRRAFMAGTAAAALAGATGVSADDYPSKPINLIILFPPGGSMTVVIRSVADKLAEALGAQIVIDNRDVAGGTVGTKALARSEPDGYTIGLGYTGTLAIGPNFYSNVGYDPRKDFGTMRMLAVTSLTRSTLAPEIPTIAEQGVPGFEAVLRYAPAAPAGTPRLIIERLNTALAGAEVRKRLALEGAEPLDEYTVDLDKEERLWAKVVKESGAKAN